MAHPCRWANPPNSCPNNRLDAAAVRAPDSEVAVTALHLLRLLLHHITPALLHACKQPPEGMSAAVIDLRCKAALGECIRWCVELAIGECLLVERFCWHCCRQCLSAIWLDGLHDSSVPCCCRNQTAGQLLTPCAPYTLCT